MIKLSVQIKYLKVNNLGRAKLTFNGVLVSISVFSAIAFLIVVKIMGMTDRTAVNSFNRIEGTDLAIRYSNIEPDGLYRGDSTNNELLVEGTFGYDWGAVVDGDSVYLNEYCVSNYALVVSKLVKIDLKTLKKEVLYDNTVLRGRCSSGEMVALSNYMLDANSPKTNRFCKLYNLGLNADYENNATILYLNPENGETVYSVQQKLMPKESFDERYIERTLEEVMG